MIPAEETYKSLSRRWLGRSSQIRQLSALLSGSHDSPPTVVVHGPEATGKSGLVAAYLESAGLQHAVVRCEECITGRHLLERAITASADALQDFGTGTRSKSASASTRCENISAFTNLLENLLKQSSKFVLVLDGIDKQREAQPTLMPALARLGRLIPTLTVILIVAHPNPRFLHTTGIPHVYFPPYDREQAVAILAAHPPKIFLREPSPSTNYSEESAAEDDAWLWTRFCQAIWDALAKGAARDLASFREIAERLWRPFVQPVVDGTFGTRDFSRLVVAQRSLLQDEGCLADKIITDQQTSPEATLITHDLPYYSKWLLCAAYLASYNPARQDALYFMKATERKRRKKGGGTAAGRQSRQRKIPRHLLSPSPFSLDRLFAILHGILPHDMTPNIDIYTQVATLGSLRLLVRSGILGSDVLEPGSKWKVNFGWDYVTKLARNLHFDITDYVAE